MDSYVLTLFDEAGNPIPIPAIQGIGIKNIRLKKEDENKDIYEVVLDDNRTYEFVVEHGKSPVIEIIEYPNGIYPDTTRAVSVRIKDYDDPYYKEFVIRDGTSVTVERVSESTTDGGTNTVAFSDGKKLNVKNGSKGNAGITPHIGENGNWFIGSTDTGVPASGGRSLPEYTEADEGKTLRIANGETEWSGGDVRYISSQTLRVGDNVLTDDMVTLGAGWSGNLTDGFTHASGSTEPLTFAVGAADGEAYVVDCDYTTNIAEKAILLSLGDSCETDPYNGDSHLTWGLVCAGDNGAFKIIPANNYKGTITNLTLRKVTDDGVNEVEIELGDIYHADMPNHLSGFWNIAMGDHALENSVNGTRNIALGCYSERALKTGSRNISIGTFSMSQLESGDRNIAIGADSLYTPKKAESCIAIGMGTLSKGNEHSSNVAIGQSAMYGAGNGKYKDSVAIGVNAGYYGGAQSSSNVFIGASAGYKNAGYMNTFIGGNAAQFATGHTCTAIGTQASTESYNGCVAIGYQAKNTKNNQVVLGADTNVETVLKGDLIVRGTDGVKRQIVFNADGTCSWTEVS